MSFIKYGSVQTLAIATNSGDSFNKSAAYSNSSSAFLDGQSKIDIRAKLQLLANEYDISADPKDYIFEAIRGNTVNVANENKDGFHKFELLRYDHRLGKQVYRTYENKPHQVNHRAENPKNARGFIVDAHYNDSANPLDTCPNCGNKTASKEARDAETGIHCIKCGEVVKDEFIELLIAIDAKKDPSFANGVLKGVLKHGSMGCSCLRTRCNVCNNVAYTRSEFCKHISQNKGKIYDETEPGFNPIAFIILDPNSKEVSLAAGFRSATKPKKTAKSFEWCEGVVFDEYSRVHDPADPKAEQYEILKLSNKIAQLEDDNKLINESEILILQARLAQLEKDVRDKMASISKTAQKDSDVNIEISEPETGPESVNIESEDPLEEINDDAIPIDELNQQNMGLAPAGPGKQLTPADMGIMPQTPGAPAAPAAQPPRLGSNQETGEHPMLRFANSYKHLQAEITDAGNVRVFDGEGTLFVVKPSNKTASTDSNEFAKNILTMIAENGIGGTITRTKAIVGPRLAQVLDYYVDDMLDSDRKQTNSILDENASDMQEARTQDQKTETATGTGEESDKTEQHDTKNYTDSSTLTDRDTDVEDEQHDRDPNSLSSVEMHDEDTREDRKDFNMNQSAVDDITVDHKDKVAGKKCDKCGEDECKCDEKTASLDIRKHASRLERLYQNRLQKKMADIENEKKEFINSFKDRFARAMKIVSRRQALNLEFSPLKTAMADALLTPRNIGNGEDYIPMDERLASILVEASFNDPIIENIDKPVWETHIDGILNRAAEVMNMNDEALMQIEADLKNMQTMLVPVEGQSTGASRTAEIDPDFRRTLKSGNLQLETGETNTQRHERRNAIKEAVGTTKVASSRTGFGL